MNFLNSIEKIKESVENNRFSILYITTEECGVCKSVYPKLLELIDKYEHLNAMGCRTNEVEGVMGELMVFTIPTIMIFYEGKEVYRAERFIRFEELEEKLDFFSEL